MEQSPEVVNCYIPLMKNLNMSWDELKKTPKHEILGLITALGEYNILHSFDGYTSKDVSDMSKNKPEVRTQYNDYLLRKRKYRGESKKKSTFKDVFN
jgi:hypothetical protein